MKLSLVGLFVAFTFCASLFSPPSVAGSATSQGPYARFSMTFYNPKRLGYESLPVLVTGAGGGKLGPNVKFKIFVSMLKNATAKNVKAVKFSYFVFKLDNLDEPIQTNQTDLIAVDLPALEQRKVDIHVVDVEDITSLSSKQSGEFRLELAVSEVQYEDGSSWQGTNLPQKMEPAKPY
ncbi:MAG TPA: hypothetical protein VGN90_15695 [Pyrinomonadaceae bacterium]|nr:hypothetical protein [Pyrinomonadaceae bacterium]